MGWIRQPFIVFAAWFLGAAWLLTRWGGLEQDSYAPIIVVGMVFYAHRRRRADRRIIAVLGVAFALFVVSMHGQRNARWHPQVFEIGESRIEAEVEGTIAEPPRIIDERWMSRVRIDRWESENCHPVELRVSGATPAPRVGHRVRVFVRVARAAPADFPGQPDRRARNEGRNAPLMAQAVDVEVLAANRGVLNRAWQALADRKVALQRRLLDTLGPERAGIAIALTTGEKAWLDERLNQGFADTGTGHVLAISGLHFGVIAAGVWMLTLFAVRRSTRLMVRFGDRRVAGLVVAISLAIFLAFVGAPVSAVRAWIGATLLIISLVNIRPFCAFHALGWAAVVVVVIDSMSIHDMGFQLSFLATISILIFLARRPVWLCPPVFGHESLWKRRGRVVALSMGVSTAATALTTPVILAHLGVVSWASFWTNLVVVPLVSVVLFPALLVGIALDTIGLTSLVMLGSMQAMVWMGEALVEIARWPGSVWVPGCPPAIATWCLGVTVVGLLLRPSTRGSISLVLSAVVICVWIAHSNPRPSGFHAYMIPVGQGDSILLRGPMGDILIDAGGRLKGPDPGRRIVVPFLRRLGVRELKALVVTHDDIDHSGGATAVLEWVEARHLVVHDHSARLVPLAQKLDIPVIATRESAWRLGELTFSATNKCASDNDGSVVTRWGRQLLLTGDIEACGEDAFVGEFDLRSNVVQAPHHGSSTSSTDAFVAATTPSLVLVSSGRHNRFDHPRDSVITRWKAGASVIGTQTHGLVHLEFQSAAIVARSKRGPVISQVVDSEDFAPMIRGSARSPDSARLCTLKSVDVGSARMSSCRPN